MKIKKRTIWLVLIVLLYSAWAAASVSAHAVLLRSNPSANAVLDQPPIQVELFFSEPLEPNLSSITVIDSNNLIVDARDARVDLSDPKRMTVTLHSLPDGVYTVSWKALSTIDGHLSSGAFPFAVGNANAAAVQEIQQSATARVPFSALVSKFLLLASLAILVGQRLFIALVWDPALKADQTAKPPVWITLYRIGLIGVLISIGIGILSQAGQTSGSELSLPWDAQTGRILIETRLGLIWLVRLVLAMLALWLMGNQESPPKNWLGFAVNLSLLFSVTLTSHAATEAKPLLPMLGDWLHLIGTAFWFGGLIHLFTGIRRLGQLDGQSSTRLTSLLTSQFSVNAILFVSLIGMTGLYSAWLRVGSWSALVTNLYGNVLLVKQVFVAGLLAIAAANLLVISPRLKRDRLQNTADTGLVARFGKILVLELMFAGLLLANVSFLTYIPPAKAVSLDSNLADATQVDDLKLDISITPGRVGQNTFILYLVSSDGHPVHAAKQVLLRFTLTQGTLPPSELQLIGQGDGTFSAKGANLSLPGKWQVQAVVRREGKFDAFANFDFTIQNPASSDKAAATAKQAGGLILVVGILSALITESVKVNRVSRFGLGMPLAVLAVYLGVYHLTRPVSIENAQANPIPPNRASIETGAALYTNNCVSCHGVAGKGDGPVGLTLNPRPADLAQHAVPGVHTDAQLFEWITNGFPGSPMPSFKTSLSDTDRWNLVNYIRTLAPK